VNSFAAALVRKGINAAGYHSDTKNRKDIEEAFHSGKVKVLVATIALAMGFDKRDIHTVVHAYTPASPVQYYQEIGRAGRHLTGCKAFILNTLPWLDVKRESAMRRLIDLLKASSSPLLREHLIEQAANINISKKVVEQALNLAIGKNYFADVASRVTLLKLPTAEEETERKEYITERQKELLFMKEMFNPNHQECIWVKLLDFLGQKTEPEFKCQKCTRCNPKDGDVRMVTTEECWQQFTPRHKIPVFAFGKTNHECVMDLDRVKDVLLTYRADIAADPPAWKITYVPDSKGQSKNKNQCMAISKALGFEMFEYITSDPRAGSMVGANTRQVRERILKDKFIFAEKMIPPPHYNIVLYDDSIKSGMTLDKVVEPLLSNQGADRKILVIVDNLWDCPDLPEPLLKYF